VINRAVARQPDPPTLIVLGRVKSQAPWAVLDRHDEYLGELGHMDGDHIR
jgi:hypothetical protein